MNSPVARRSATSVCSPPAAKIRSGPSGQNITIAWRTCLQGSVRAGRCLAKAQSHCSGWSPQMPGRTDRLARPGLGGNPKRFSSSSLQSPGRPAYAAVLKSRARGRPEKCDSGLRGGRQHMPAGHARVVRPGLGGNPKRSSSSPPEKEEAGSGILARGVQRHHQAALEVKSGRTDLARATPWE